MQTKEWLKSSCASLLVAALAMQPVATLAQTPRNDGMDDQKKLLEIAPRSSAEVARYTNRIESAPNLTHAQKLALLQKNIKYVFVLFQENRSFDFYFGTYPGARGLFSQPADQTPGFVQPIVLTDGSVGTISPFKIPQSVTVNGSPVLLYPEDTDSVNHSHVGIDAKLDVNTKNVALNDRYAFTEEGLTGTLTAGPNGFTYTGALPTEKQVQKGELVVSHVDCDTAPFLWNYADRFTLFDNFFDTVIGPSTPNAISMIAGQSGMTQWVKHPELGLNVNTTNAQLPVVGDPQPFWGSALDIFTPPNEKQPVDNPGGVSSNPASNLTFASLPPPLWETILRASRPTTSIPPSTFSMCKPTSRKLLAARTGRYIGVGSRKDMITSPRTLLVQPPISTTSLITTARSTSATKPTIWARLRPT
jgi:phospholipase C